MTSSCHLSKNVYQTIFLFIYIMGEPGKFVLRNSVESKRNCILSDGTQRRVLPCYQNQKIKILIISFALVAIDLQPSRSL